MGVHNICLLEHDIIRGKCWAFVFAAYQEKHATTFDKKWIVEICEQYKFVHSRWNIVRFRNIWCSVYETSRTHTHYYFTQIDVGPAFQISLQDRQLRRRVVILSTIVCFDRKGRKSRPSFLWWNLCRKCVCGFCWTSL